MYRFKNGGYIHVLRRIMFCFMACYAVSICAKSEPFPHALSMNAIGRVETVVGHPFSFSFKNYIKFYDENVQAGYPPEGIVEPDNKKGLHFDAKTLSITGVPTQAGIITFKVGAFNEFSKTELVDLVIYVDYNKDCEIKFKPNPEIPIATPGKEYSLNLDTLIEPDSIQAGDQVHYQIYLHQQDTDYLQIDPYHINFLKGNIRDDDAGKTLTTTISALSNICGESQQQRISIPVAIDETKRPVLHEVDLGSQADMNFYDELRGLIDDPVNDGSLKIILERTEPQVDWIHIAPDSPTALSGLVPADAVGMHIKLFLRASNEAGGPSELVEGIFDVGVNPELTPRFNMDKPVLPMVQPGVPYQYCFTEQQDITPAYDVYPFTVELDKDRENPSWVRLENSCIIVDSVDENLERYPILWVRIKNVPGGISNPSSVRLPIAGLLAPAEDD